MEGGGPSGADGPRVQIGDDQAIPNSQNWAAMSHQQLYDAVHQGNNPGDAHGLGREWTALGDEMKESARALGERVRGTESGWRGEAADAARQAISDLVAWAETAAETSSQMGDRIAGQAQIAERAKAAMPEPVHFDAAQELANAVTTGGTSGLVAMSADLKHKSDHAQSAHDQAVNVMQTMESGSRHVDANTPRFTLPPEVVQAPQAGACLQSSTPSRGGLPTREQPSVEPQAANTVSAAARPATVVSGRQSPSLASGHDAWNSGAAAVSGGVPVGSSQSHAAAASGEEARGGAAEGRAASAASSGSSGGGLHGPSALTVKLRPVGSPADGTTGAPTSQASYTPPGMKSSQSDSLNSSSGSAPRAADGPVRAHGPSPGSPPGQFGAGARGGGSSRSSGSSSGRGQPGPASRNPGASSEMRDPNYWTHKPGSGDKGSPPASQAGTRGRPASTSAAAANSIGGVGAASIPGGEYSMSGQLPPAGSEGMPPGGVAGTSQDVNQAPLTGGAQGASSVSTQAAQSQGNSAMGPMGAGAGGQGGQGEQEKQRRSPGYIRGEKIVEEPEHVAPTVLGEKFKKKQQPYRD